MAALVKQLHRAAGAFSSRLDGPWSSVVVPCRCVTAGRSATDKGQVAYEGRTFNKLSRLKSSSRIRGAVIADANELEAVDAFNEESTTTAGHSIFPARFKASSKGSHCDRNIRATMGDKDDHGGLRRQGTSQFLGVRQRRLAVWREEIKSPASRAQLQPPQRRLPEKATSVLSPADAIRYSLSGSDFDQNPPLIREFTFQDGRANPA